MFVFLIVGQRVLVRIRHDATASVFGAVVAVSVNATRRLQD
jgi:hypothetical protein